MLLPLFHDKMTVRRWPWVTTAIVVASLAIFGVSVPFQKDAEAKTLKAAVTAMTFYSAHPYLHAKAPLDRIDQAMKRRSGFSWVIGNANTMAPLDDDERDEQQKELDRLTDQLDQAMWSEPHVRFGYGPKNRVFGLVTATFMHGSWPHVIFNMWFLLLCGMNLEDRWGRPQFAAFYLIAGVIAAFCHGLASNVAVIGASGAVAGAMGAFLVLFAKTRIRFLAFFIATFRAPAWVALPLWAAVEVYDAVGANDGVAHWAHLGGFFFGLAVAGGLKLTGIDRKLDDAVEKAATLGSDPRVDTALALARAGKLEPAEAMLRGLAVEQPDSVHAHRALYFVALLKKDAAGAAAMKDKVLALYTRHGEGDTGRAIVEELAVHAVKTSQTLGVRDSAISFPNANAKESG
jgi:membrane associated rhomboid family serine protease